MNPTTSDKQLFLDAQMAHDQALYRVAAEAKHPRTDCIPDPHSAALQAAGEVIAKYTAALRARIKLLEDQLEHEHGFDVANDAYAKDGAKPWPPHADVPGEEVFAHLEKENGEPRESAIRLSKFIPLDHQFVTITRANLRRLVEWVNELKIRA